MIRLITFDLDGTLAELGAPTLPEHVEQLRLLEQRGFTIAVCSGKPTYYLCGFLRQLGLQRPVLAGENGAVIQLGIDLPPKEFYIQPYSDAAKESIVWLRNELERQLPGLFYQPNLVGLTPFPTSKQQFDRIQQLLDRNADRLRDVEIYRHADSFDITPCGLNKFSGMELLGRILSISPAETACVGDGVNDYPMFAYAGLSIGIHLAQPEKADMNFKSIGEALNYLLTI